MSDETEVALCLSVDHIDQRFDISNSESKGRAERMFLRFGYINKHNHPERTQQGFSIIHFVLGQHRYNGNLI